jgi:hypothetical protein
MRYFKVYPEVAGGPGENTVQDTSTHPPIVHKFHYEIETWLGDAILWSFPCFITTDELSQAIERAGFTGVRFAPVEMSISEQCREFEPELVLPAFRWMQVHGHGGKDDFGLAKLVLVVSQRALDLLRRFGAEHAEVEDFDAGGDA